MKNFKIAVFLVSIGFLTSCSITEKLTVNEKGAGVFAYEIDGSKMISMVGSTMKEESGKSKKKKKGKKENDVKEVIDSTFSFKELYADKQDSIAKLPVAEQEKIKKLERFSMRMIIDEENGIMKYNMFTDFNSIEELKEVLSPLETMKSISPEANQSGGFAMAPNTLEENSSTSFFYDGKTFKKIVAKKATEEKPIEEKSEEDQRIEESLNMFYEQSTFKIVYEFPKPVKTISIESALFSQDKKTITIEYPLKSYMENPDALNFSIEFE